MMSVLQESKQNNPTVDSPNHRRTGSLCLSPDLGPACIALPTRGTGRAIQGDITPILTKPEVVTILHPQLKLSSFNPLQHQQNVKSKTDQRSVRYLWYHITGLPGWRKPQQYKAGPDQYIV